MTRARLLAVALAAVSVVWISAHTTGAHAATPLAAAVGDAAGDVAMPFGLRKGMTRAEMGLRFEELGNGMLRTESVPKPHPAFEAYIVQVGPTQGLCFVKGVGKDVETSVYGSELRTAYTKLRDQVAQSYGAFRETDTLLPGSIWSEPRDWMMALLKKERMLAATWNEETRATLKRDLRDIYLVTSALSAETGWISLEYYFDNETACQEEIDAAAGAVL